MNREIAELIAKVAFRCSADLSDLVPTIKNHLPDNQYDKYAQAIANISGSISLEILRPIFAQYPELEAEFDQRIKNYGRLF